MCIQNILEVSQIRLPRETVNAMMRSGGSEYSPDRQHVYWTVNQLKQMASEVGAEKSQLTPVEENQL